MNLEIVEKNIYNAKIIWTWRNDPTTRKNSLRTNFILWEDFYFDFNNKYFENKVPPFFITYNNEIVGFIGCVDFKNDSTTIGINIDPNKRGNGYGSKSINLLVNKLIEDYEIKFIRAVIKKSNLISQKIFLKNKFKFVEEQNNLYIYSRQIIN